MTLIFHFGSSLFILFQDGGELLILYPLVAHEFEAVFTGVAGQISIGRVDETGGQAILLLQGGVSQGSVGGILGQILGFFSAQGAVQVLTGLLHGFAYVGDHGLGGLHILEHGSKLLDVACNLIGHIYQGVELLRARLHYKIGGDDTVFIIFVVQQELLHIVGILRGGLAGETGRLGHVSAGIVNIYRPVENLGGDETQEAYGYYRYQNDDDAFFLFHRATDIFLLGTLIHLLQK